MNKKYVIWGSAGHAKVLRGIIEFRGGEVAALFDNRLDAKAVIPNVPIFFGKNGYKQWLNHCGDPSDFIGVTAIGGAEGLTRVDILDLYRKSGLRLDSLVHHSASIAADVEIGPMCQVLANSTLAAEVSLGEACIINHSAVVDHETKLGRGVHVAPGAVLCGCITAEDYVFIGAGATILPRIVLHEGAIIGAGAIVTNDVPAGSLVRGNPARVVE